MPLEFYSVGMKPPFWPIHVDPHSRKQRIYQATLSQERQSQEEKLLIVMIDLLLTFLKNHCPQY
jgi:hypothetical protein